MKNQMEHDFVDEIIFCIKEKDVIKAQAALQYFLEVSPAAQNRALFEIGKAEDKIAFLIIEELLKVKIKDVEVRIKLYELFLDKSIGQTEKVLKYIATGEDDTRRTFIRIAGDLKLTDAAPLLKNILQGEMDKDLLREVLRALGRTGDPSNADDVADFVYYGDDELKETAVQALGSIGGATAIKHLSDAVDSGKGDDLILFTIDRLKEELAKTDAKEDGKSELEELNTQLISESPSLRHSAMQQLIEKGPDAAEIILENLKSDDTDLLVKTMVILGYLGDKDIILNLVSLLKSKPKDPAVRFAAFEALERLDSAKAALTLIDGLDDPEEYIRIAAAKSLNKNVSEVIIVGLRSNIDTGAQKAKQIVASIMDARAGKLFKALLASDAFATTAANYLTGDVMPELRDYFIDVLESSGNKSSARRIAMEAPPADKKKKIIVYVVNDSKIMLDYYYKKLSKMGYQPKGFESSEEAFNAIQTLMPDLLLTALNMPGESGLEFTQKIRELVDSKELPIFLVSGQKKYSQEGTGNDEVKAAGVDDVFYKFFNDKDFKKIVKKYNLKPKAAELQAEQLKIATANAALAEAETELVDMTEMLSSPYVEIRHSVIYEMIFKGSKAVPVIVKFLQTASDDAVVNALMVLGNLSDPSATAAIFKLLDSKPKNPSVRFSGYVSLKEMLSQKDAMSIITGLDDKSEMVRMATAWLLDSLINEEIVLALRSRIDKGGSEFMGVVTAIVDSMSNQAFSALLSSDSFTIAATDYLTREIHPAVRSNFLEVLNDSGNKSMAKRIQMDAVSAPLGGKPSVYFTDVSLVMRHYLTKKLFNAGCDPVGFESPEDLIEETLDGPPDLVVINLNTPVMSGIQISEEIRAKVPADEMPILLITTQNDFVAEPSEMNDDLKDAGINAVINKNFTNKELDKTIKSLLKK